MRLRIEHAPIVRQTVAAIILVACCTTFTRADAAFAGPKVQAAPTAGEKASLATLLDKLDWEPRSRGVLIIVSPETTFPATSSADSTGDAVTATTEGPPPIAAADGSYSLAAVAQAYDRIVIRVGDLTVLAPGTMTVLNYTHLPQPDPYAGMTSPEKLRLLESTFTDAEWKAAGSEDGIGVSDMTGEQSSIFLSLLPRPFDVIPLPAPGARFDRSAAVTLSDDQRAATRLRLQKRLDFLFREGRSNTAGTYTDINRADSTYNYEFTHSRGENPVPARNSTANQHEGMIYGVEIASVVPDRAKPTQLPTDWGAIDISIRFQTARTVGALVQEIARQTGAKLYCDPRYARLTVALRGESATASDVLRALARAVTGTWRRVGDAFVLTDDLVGLGVRHVRIDEWADRTAALAQLQKFRADKTVAAKQYKAIGWSATDPAKPDDALIAKMDAFVARPQIPWTGSGPADQSPDVSLADLPQSLQDNVREQVRHYNEYIVPQLVNGQPRPLISTEGMKMGVRVQPSYIIPGVGRLAATDLPVPGVDTDILAKQYIRVFDNYHPGTVSTLPPLKFSPALTNRALFLDSSDKKELETAAKEAHLRGFTQLWVTVSPGDSDLLAAAVRAGSANALAVHAVVRLLKATKADPPEALDRNLLGETAAEYIARRRTEVNDILAKTGPIDMQMSGVSWTDLGDWIEERTIVSAGRLGDFRRTTPAEQTAIAAEVSRLASVPGLAGLVLQDTESPGSEAVSAKTGENYIGFFTSDPGMQMGYDDATRLDCLRQLGFDPVDLSPLPGGDGNEGTMYSPFARGGRSERITLPFFPDSGGLVQKDAYVFFNRQRQTSLPAGSTSLWRSWCEFRHARSEALIASVASAARAKHPDLSILIKRYDEPVDDLNNWYRSLEKPDASPVVASTPTSDRPLFQRDNTSIREQARAESRTSYFRTVVGGYVARPSTRPIPKPLDEQLDRLTYILKLAPAWDGLVLDLTQETPAGRLATLALFPVVDPGR